MRLKFSKYLPGHCNGPLPKDLKRAIEFINLNLTEQLNVSDLVMASGVCERTLFLHFKEFLGTSPKEYIKSLRLEKVREELIHCEQFNTVKQIALEYGFTQLGRFSGLYKKTYGELPSETLKHSRQPIYSFSDSKARS